jgi:hypothetical protein
VLARQVVHPRAPAHPPVLARRGPVAQRTLHGPRGLFAAKVTLAMDHPLVPVGGDVPAAQEPERTLIHGRACGRPRPLQHAVVVLQQRHARQVVCEPRANRRLGRRRVGVARSQRRRMRRHGRGLVNQRRRHRRAAAERAGVLPTQRARGRRRLLCRGVEVEVDAGKARVNVRRRLAHPVFGLQAYEAFQPRRKRHAARAGGVLCGAAPISPVRGGTGPFPLLFPPCEDEGAKTKYVAWRPRGTGRLVSTVSCSRLASLCRETRRHPSSRANTSPIPHVSSL